MRLGVRSAWLSVVETDPSEKKEKQRAVSLRVGLVKMHIRVAAGFVALFFSFFFFFFIVERYFKGAGGHGLGGLGAVTEGLARNFTRPSVHGFCLRGLVALK